MSSSHPPSVRNQALQLLFQGRSVRDVAVQLGLPQQTVYRWHRTCISQSELMQARARIEMLEGEVAACRHLIDLMKEVVPPKDATR
ncbi:helix-turn-helix domain-containing protein [Streptomyces sp. NPDC057746]|uniref:helix-turn-helix domain-containing protein n=1 Tax=Streptomyces sp. NPDC057746 TaxID=3346237 RepID=UPI0036C8AC9F